MNLYFNDKYVNEYVIFQVDVQIKDCDNFLDTGLNFTFLIFMFISLSLKNDQYPGDIGVLVSIPAPSLSNKDGSKSSRC